MWLYLLYFNIYFKKYENSLGLTLLQFSQEYFLILLWEIASCLISKGRWQNLRGQSLQE